ncbi:MAG: LacI family DNA-binding transcriptional regulator [Burkholderiales bacterium]|nr:LacI family DNA-binding transcriptional regulator [Burkholderiales bacterium]
MGRDYVRGAQGTVPPKWGPLPGDDPSGGAGRAPVAQLRALRRRTSSVVQRSPAPRITDVARHAGVSMKTVSRVLNDEPNVQPQMRERVLAAVTALNYRPNVFARSLASSRSYVLGLLYYVSSAEFVGGLQQGATARCRALGYHLVVESLEDNAHDVERQLSHLVHTLRPDGLILAPPVCDDPQVLAALAQAEVRCVRISPGSAGAAVGRVSMDDTAAAREMTEFLVGLGHRRIGFIQGDPAQAAAPRRHQGYLEALAAHHIALDPELVVPGDFTFRSGLQACERLLALAEPPSAIFAANDDMAMGAVMAAQRSGHQVPGDLSVAGFDDSTMASLVWPQLTTVRQPVAEMAIAAVDMLVARATAKGQGETPPASEAVLPHALVERGTTAPPRLRRGVRRSA